MRDWAVEQIVALGVGHFEGCLKACSQLALLLYLKEAGNVSNITVFDPIFTESEQSHLHSLQLHHSEQYCINSPCLFYMIHCHLDLYESVLLANISSPRPILLVSNSLKSYTDRINPALREVVANCTEIALFSTDPAFNDTYLVRLGNNGGGG